MSWNVLLAENSQGMHDLREAIQKASTKGILLYCAASENNASTTGDEAWPAACRETISIGAANDNRGRRDYVGADAKFLFPSTHDGEDRGSSAATAVAAGLGSLILYCLKAKQCEELSSNLEKGRQVDQKEKHGSRRERQTDEKTGKIGQKEKQSLQQVSFAAGDDPRGMMLKVFGSLCPDKTSNYVDIDMLLGKGPISYGSITKHCEPHITKAGTQKRILLKASSGM